MKPLAIPNRQRSKNRLADPSRLLENCVEDRYQIAGRGIDYLEDLGGCGLLISCRVTLGFGLSKLGFALGKLTSQIGYELLGIGERAVGRHAHLRTSSEPIFRADHTVVNTATIG